MARRLRHCYRERKGTETLPSSTEALIKMLMIVLPGMMAMLCSLNFAVTAPSNMRPATPCLRLLCPRLAWFLGLMLLAGLPGCGPAASDHAPNPESLASLGTPS